MCGLTGFFAQSGQLNPVAAQAHLEAMTRAIAHRGPDAEGHRFFQEDGAFMLGLGHRRLSIIDLSPAGAQPMASHDGRYAIAFNGEIYNFAELRSQIEARRGPVAWRGHSDTEVLLELIAEQGIEKALTQLDGMFALAVFDRQERRLTLARDPFGEKPLVYGFWCGVLLFGSELKALRAWPGFAPAQNAQALADYLKYSYVPAPATIFEGIYKLPAAHCVAIGLAELASQELPEPQPYWDMVDTALAAQNQRFDGTPSEAADLVERAMQQSTQRRMVSDVPLGALLSGGIDSSLTTALMQTASQTPVRTFTIGMDEPGYNESAHAFAVSQHLGTDHTALLLTPAQVQAVIPDIAGVHDEPFADASQVPTYLVARMAREQVTVVLSGDGGDELFAGYNRYFHGPRVWSRLQSLPGPLRRGVGSALHAVPPALLDRTVRLAGPLAPRDLAAGRAGEKLHKLGGLMSARDRTEFHNRLLATGAPERILVSRSQGQLLTSRADARSQSLDFAAQAMLLDTANYMPDDVLTKVDRASMAVSLETRTPFLNRELFELAWRLPMAMKLAGSEGKSVLRQVLYRHVPQQLVDRPKAGFAVPVGRWLRGPLREWGESLLSNSALLDAGVFDAKAVRAVWAEHLSGQSDHETLLWSVLMYQGWRNSAGQS